MSARDKPPQPTAMEPRPGTALDAARAFGIVSGGPAVLVLLELASLAFAVRALIGGDAPPWPAIVGLAALALYLGAFRPWSRRWGTHDGEAHGSLPGDELVADPGITMTRALTIEAPVHAVWPWLAQIGQDRGGFYSYAWLENLAGCGLKNADRVHREWQHRQVGDIVLLHPCAGPKLARFEPNRSYAFDIGWYFALESKPGGRTRLFARSRVPRGVTSIMYSIFMELPHFIMERRMLLGIKQRAERAGS